MQKLNGVKHSMSVKSQIRRKSVIERLEAQLKSGVKTFGNYISGGTTDLTKSDIKRINSELLTLKSRV